MRRLDLRLTELGLAPTRSKAQQMIRAGEVEVFARDAWRVVTDVSHPADQVRVVADAATLKYASRGGFKLAGALNHLSLDVKDWRALDVGLSTGGFTDCLLQRGAGAVLGLDVGHGQLHARLRDEPRLTAIEGLNARELDRDPRVTSWCAGGAPRLIVADLSFISLTLVIPALAAVAAPGTRALLLVKPQFETSADRLSRRGVVEDPAVYASVEARVSQAFAAHFVRDDYFASVITGQDGNREFFITGTRGS